MTKRWINACGSQYFFWFFRPYFLGRSLPGIEIELGAQLDFLMTTSPTQTPYTEPWLRGTHADVPAAARAVLHALDLALDDLTKWTAGLADAEIRASPLGLTPIAFHLRHIAGSTDRILTYAEGGQLSAVQLAALKGEQGSEGNQESLAELLAAVEAAFSDAGERIRVLAGANLDTPRFVGRKQLPASLGGAMIHVADHTQRHVGQVVTTAKVLRAMRD
jgi:DinB superfamily